jgi:hypothetical protein
MLKSTLHLLQVTPEQERALIQAYKSGPDQLQANGIHLGNTKYMFLRPVENSFYGKKGVCIHSTQTSSVPRTL